MNSEVATAIQAIASVVNLVFVIIFFIWERFSGQKERKREKEEFWYRETLLSRGMDILNGCFDEIEKILQKANDFNNQRSDTNEQQTKRLVCEVKKQIAILKRSVLLYVKLFDKNLALEMKTCMNRLEDGVTEELETCYFSGSAIDEFSVILEKYKYELVSKLYKFDTGRE